MGEASSEIEVLRDEVEWSGLASTRGLQGPVGGDKARGNRGERRVACERTLYRLVVSSDRGDIGVKQEHELASGSRDALVHSDRVADVAVVLDDGCLGGDSDRRFPSAVTRGVVHEDDACALAGEGESSLEAIPDEPCAPVADNNDVESHDVLI
jgi:hypothetical protein